MLIKSLALKLFLFYTVVASQWAYSQSTIVVGADEWVDYTAKDGSGIYFNLLKKIYPKQKLVYKLQPFNKTLALFKQQQIDVLVGAYKYEIPRALFSNWYLDTEFPLLAFYNKKNRKITRSSDLIGLKPSWLAAYNFSSFVPSKKTPLLVDSLRAGFDALKQGKSDIFIEYAYNQLDDSKDYVASFEILPKQHIYVAFQHNQQGQKLAQQFDQQMEKLRLSGGLQQIFGKEYQLSDLENYITNKQKIIIYTNALSLLNNRKTVNNKEQNVHSLKAIFDTLNGYDFEFKSFKNIAQMYRLKNQNNVCFSDLIDTKKRAQEFVVSKPLSLFLGFRLYSNKPLSIPEPIDLKAFLDKNRQLRLGTVNGRSYGKQLDDILATIRDEQLVQSPVDISTLFKQFSRKRFDLLIEYPSVKTNNLPKQYAPKLYSYQIKGAEKYILGHMMCSNSLLGKEFIYDFNQKLTEFYHSGYFFNAQYQRILPKNRPVFTNYFNQVFESNKH